MKDEYFSFRHQFDFVITQLLINMGTLTYLILLIFGVVAQHEILASSPDASSSLERGFYIAPPTPPTYAQGLRLLTMDDPTEVKLTVRVGTKTHVIGRGLAIHPRFAAVRRLDLQPGCRISAYQGEKLTHFAARNIILGPKDNVALFESEELILLGGKHTVKDGFSKYGYGQREYDWVKWYINNWIEEYTLPLRLYRGDED